MYSGDYDTLFAPVLFYAILIPAAGFHMWCDAAVCGIMAVFEGGGLESGVEGMIRKVSGTQLVYVIRKWKC